MRSFVGFPFWRGVGTACCVKVSLSTSKMPGKTKERLADWDDDVFDVAHNNLMRMSEPSKTQTNRNHAASSRIDWDDDMPPSTTKTTSHLLTSTETSSTTIVTTSGGFDDDREALKGTDVQWQSKQSGTRQIVCRLKR